MPYMVCPECGKREHVNVPNPVVWYATRFPELTLGDDVPGLCYDCMQRAEKEKAKEEQATKNGDTCDAAAGIDVAEGER